MVHLGSKGRAGQTKGDTPMQASPGSQVSSGLLGRSKGATTWLRLGGSWQLQLLLEDVRSASFYPYSPHKVFPARFTFSAFLSPPGIALLVHMLLFADHAVCAQDGSSRGGS